MTKGLIEFALINDCANLSKTLEVQKNTEIVDEEGKTALRQAARNGCVEAVQLLLQAGANVNAKTSDGVTPLISAAYYGHAKVVELLLNSRRVEIEACNKEGSTALFYAAYYGHTKVVELLLKAGAKKEVLEQNSLTPLIVATYFGYKQIVLLLLAYGADLNKGADLEPDAIKRGHGEVRSTALFWAYRQHNVEMQEILQTSKQKRDPKPGYTPTLFSSGVIPQAYDQDSIGQDCWADFLAVY